MGVTGFISQQSVGSNGAMHLSMTLLHFNKYIIIK